MRVEFPVRLDDGTVIQGNEKSFMISTNPDFKGVNGYDNKGARITNIVGFNGKELLKKCTSCGAVLPSADGFGPEGRSTTPGLRRDQAQCVDCRQKY